MATVKAIDADVENPYIQQAEEEALRHTTTLRILKDRYTGRSTGECVYLTYDSNTGRINSTKKPCPFDEQGEETNVDF